MERTFRIRMDYYDTRKLFKHNTFTIKEGITVLIGCNGAGKSTILHAIETALKEKKIPVMLYDNLHAGGSRAVEDAFYSNNFSLVSSLTAASEGEAISVNVMNQRDNISEFITKGKEIEKNIFASLFDKKDEKVTTKERWILFDAIDSGYSIDQVRDLKEMVLHNIYNTATDGGYEIHIVISANEYELAKDEACFDVIEGDYVNINSYDDFARHIMTSRKYKDKSRERYLIKYEKEQEKEKLKKKQEETEKSKKENTWMRTRGTHVKTNIRNEYRPNAETYDR